jgi:hypothetical protein
MGYKEGGCLLCIGKVLVWKEGRRIEVFTDSWHLNSGRGLLS